MVVKYYADLFDAIERVQELNEKGIKAQLAHLPVRNDKCKDVRREVAECHYVLDQIRKNNLDCELTIKLHQFGIYTEKKLAEKSVGSIVKHAGKTLVWIDMEKSNTTQDTLDIYRTVKRRFPNIGICLQAYLRRSDEDMKALLRSPSTMRLVKGFYKEHDFDTWKQVTKHYDKLMTCMLKRAKRPCVATHDLKLINKAKKLAGRKVEFQFFNGVRDKLAEKLARQGYAVSIYIPYGSILKFLLGLGTMDLKREIQRFFHRKVS